MRRYFSFFICMAVLNASAQQAAYFDAAQAYNKLVIDKKQGELMRVGVYKVSGSPYLFGGRKDGYVFQTGDSGHQVLLTYNIFTKEITFITKELADVSLTKEPGSVDSFMMKADPSIGLSNDIHFIYGPLLGTKEKTYFQLISAGPKYSLYKKYSADLQIRSDNYSQPDLRQFNIMVDYYYVSSDKKGLNKLKTTVSTLKNEFSKVTELEKSIDPDALVVNKETELKKIFTLLNKE